MNFNLGFLCLYILFIFEHSANDSYKVPYENKQESFIMPDVSSVWMEVPSSLVSRASEMNKANDYQRWLIRGPFTLSLYISSLEM